MKISQVTLTFVVVLFIVYDETLWTGPDVQCISAYTGAKLDRRGPVDFRRIGALRHEDIQC